MSKLSVRAIEALKPTPGGGDTWAWDSTLPGFGVRCLPSGVKTFLIQYRHDGRTRRYVIGKVRVLTLEQARDHARELLASIAKGADPAGARQTAKNALTVSELCDWYLTEARAGRLLGRRGQPIKPGTLSMDASRIAQHVKPLLGRRTVAGLNRADVAQFQALVAAGKSAKRKAGGSVRGGQTTGGAGVAGRSLSMLAAIFSHAARAGLIERNPALGVRRLADGKNERFLTIEEISTLGRTLNESVTEPAVALSSIRFILATGLRRNEALSLQWSHVDFKGRSIRLADTKTGAQLRPLGRGAAEILESVKKSEGWVFPAQAGNGHFVGLPSVLDRIAGRAGLGHLTVHQLRHSFASVAATLGFSELIIKGLLGHSARGVTQAYSHLPDTAILSAADRVSSAILDALNGRGEPATVVQLRSVT